MYCRKCGCQHADDIKFCPRCGTKVGGESKEQQEVQPKKKNAGIIIAIVVAAVLTVAVIALAVMCFFFSSPEDKETTSNKSAVSDGNTDHEAEDEKQDVDNPGNALEFYQALQDNKSCPYTLNSSAEAFLEEHESFFPAKDAEKLSKFTDTSVEYKHLNKNIDKYGDELFYGSPMYVLEIGEELISEDFYLTTIQTIDKDGNDFVILYRGELPEIFEKDEVSVYGLPLGLTSFDNIGGGTTKAVILAGCSVDEGAADYVACYQPILEQVAQNYNASEDATGYYIYDVDNDEIMELLVTTGDTTLGYQIDVYTIENNQVVYVGGEEIMGGLYVADDGNGIYIAYGHMGCEYVDRMTKQGSTINLETAWSIDTGCINYYYENDHPLMKYDISDYEMLGNSSADTTQPVVVAESDSYQFRTSNCSYLTESDLAGLNATECKIARNEIYARYGRLFTDPDLQAYFNGKRWYYGLISPEEFDDNVLNEYERANLDLIVQYETAHGYR